MKDGKERTTLAACCGVHIMQDGLSATLYVLLPVLAQSFGLSYTQVGFVRGTSTAAMMFFEIPSGVLAERFGERMLLVFGVGCAGLGYVALAVSSTFVAIVGSLLVAGFGAAFQHALSSSVITQSFEGPKLRTALGAFNSSGDAGKLAFTGLFTLAMGLGAGWPGIVTAYGAIALVAGVLLLITLRHCEVGGRITTSPSRRSVTEQGKRLGWGIRDRTGFTALSLMVFFDITVQGGFLTFLAFLMLEKQVPASLAGFAVVLTLAGGMFGKFGCGVLAAKLGIIRALVVVEILSSVGIIAILLAPTLVAYCLLPFVGSVLQGSSTITYGTVADLVHGQRQSRAFGIIYTIAGGSTIAGTLGFGLIGDWFSLSVAMVVMAIVVLLPLPLSLLLRPALGTRLA